jgi:conjugative relaxase-like TrwC/TraI family protein
MLSMASIGSASSAGSYYTKDNYYTSDNPLGQSEWGGEAAEALALTGSVEVQDFENVLAGHLPNGETLTGGAKERAAGFDMTFSAPKSVSLMALVGGDKRLVVAHQAAVKTTMAWVESRMAEAREGKDGARTVPTGKLAYALFTHDVSRELDPQLHTHSVIANVTQRPDGEWRALHNGKIWNANMLIGAIYHNELRHNVEKLGYAIQGGGKNGTFEIAGIDRDTVEAWSARHMQIREIARDLNVSSQQGLRAIAERSREAKDDVDPAFVRQTWRDHASERGDNFAAMIPAAPQNVSERGVMNRIRNWGDTLMKAVTPYFRPSPDPLISDNDKLHRADPLAASYAVGASVRHLQEREASFTQNQVLQNALNFAEQKARIGDIEARVAQLTANGELIAGGGKFGSRLTTPDMVRTEQKILATAKAGIGEAHAAVTLSKAGALIDAAATEKQGIDLNPEQRRAGAAIIASPDRYVAIQGGAGTGKSTIFAAVEAVDPQIRGAVFALTPQNRLAAELGEATGIDTRSLASFLTKFENLAGTREQPNSAEARLYAGATIILDEASMVSSRQMLGFMQIAEKLDVNRIVMVGDSGQIASVEAGSPFRQLQDKTLPTMHLDENLRQRDGDMKEAVALLQTGYVQDAFDKLANRITEAGDPVSSAAGAWLALDDQTRSNTSIFTSGHRLRTDMLDTLRGALVQEGKLGATEFTLPVLQSLNLTREQMRSFTSYNEGQVLDVHRDTAAIGLRRGSYAVTAVDPKAREVTVQAGSDLHTFRPEKLHPNAVGLSLSRSDEISVRTGDVLHWTASDKSQGIASGQTVTLAGINDQRLSFVDSSGKATVLDANDPMAQRLDHALVLNMHKAQGLTVENAITVMHSGNRMLNNQSLAYVLASRSREGFELHIDSRHAIIDQLEGNSGARLSAIDIADSTKAPISLTNERENSVSVAVENAKPSELPIKVPELEKTRDFDIS